MELVLDIHEQKRILIFLQTNGKHNQVIKGCVRVMSCRSLVASIMGEFRQYKKTYATQSQVSTAAVMFPADNSEL